MSCMARVYQCALSLRGSETVWACNVHRERSMLKRELLDKLVAWEAELRELVSVRVRSNRHHPSLQKQWCCQKAVCSCQWNDTCNTMRIPVPSRSLCPAITCCYMRLVIMTSWQVHHR